MNARIQLHRVQHIARLERERLERRAHDMEFVNAACQAENCAARVRIPVRRPQSRESRHHIAPVCILHSCREELRLRRIVQYLELVAQPLDRGAGYVYRSFQGIRHLAVNPPRDRGQQPVVRQNRLMSHIHQHEAAGAVGVFRIARVKTPLPEQRRLLIPRVSADRNRAAEELRVRLAVNTARRLHLRQDAHRNVQNPAQLFIPLQCMNIEDHGSGRVRVIRDMRRSLGQLVDQPGIHRAKTKLPLLGQLPDAGNVLQNPADFCAGEVRVDDEACFAAEKLVHLR